MYESNVAAGRSPYAGVELRDRSEVEWILKERGWSTHSGIGASNVNRVDLSDAVLRGLDLSGIDLRHALLIRSDLRRTQLAHCKLFSADLTDAILTDADLISATLSGAHLQGASLQSVNLRGALLSDADLQGADLRGARMDADTRLDGACLDSQSKLGDVVWNQVPLMRTDWSHARELGDEAEIRMAETNEQKIDAYRRAGRAYHGLALALRTQGLTEPASQYRLRGLKMQRAAALAEHRYGRWIFSCVLNIVSGYGERPGRALCTYLSVVGACAAAYFVVTRLFESKSQHLTAMEALVLSISSFHGRGFLPSRVYTLDDPVAYVASLEAIIGLLIEVIVIATLSRRFLGD